MLELLAQEADSTCQEWAAVIVEDLVDHAQDLFSGHASKDLLINAIQTPGDPDPIPARLKAGPKSFAGFPLPCQIGEAV